MLQNKRTIPARNNRSRHQVSHSVASNLIKNNRNIISTNVPLRPNNRSTDRTAGVNIDKRNILGSKATPIETRPDTKHSHDTMETSAAINPGALQYNTAQPAPVVISVIEESNVHAANNN